MHALVPILNTVKKQRNADSGVGACAVNCVRQLSHYAVANCEPFARGAVAKMPSPWPHSLQVRGVVIRRAGATNSSYLFARV